LGTNLLGLSYSDVKSIDRLYRGVGGGNSHYDELRERINGSESFFNAFLSTDLRKRGILKPHHVMMHLQTYTCGMLDDIEDPEIYLTGSGAEACLYDNPLFRRERYNLNEIYPTRSLNVYMDAYSDTHGHSDIDLVVFTDDEQVLKSKAESILRCLQENCTNLSNKIIMKQVNASKYRFTGGKMPREIDLFMSNRNPASLLYNYHIATCRVLIPLSHDLNIIKNKTIMMQSMVISAHLGFCVDRRWFSSKSSLYDRILRQFSRGIGMLLNIYEMQMVKDYINNSPKWRHLSNIITLEQVDDPSGANGAPQITRMKVILPGFSGDFFSAQKFNVGQYFYGSEHVLPDYYGRPLSINSETCNTAGSVGTFSYDTIPGKTAMKNQDGSFIFSSKSRNVQ
jgi:hypothetical protein